MLTWGHHNVSKSKAQMFFYYWFDSKKGCMHGTTTVDADIFRNY